MCTRFPIGRTNPMWSIYNQWNSSVQRLTNTYSRQLQLNDFKGESTLNDSSKKKNCRILFSWLATSSISDLILPEHDCIQFFCTIEVVKSQIFFGITIYYICFPLVSESSAKTKNEIKKGTKQRWQYDPTSFQVQKEWIFRSNFQY